ncbi:hypothetical protein CSIM01_05553 [Colletotrichum simmondsii]|uniref:Uncharacterized protein n=1 Tax=Colletotrichum simmondsii TaxID=703756 RepID=A0A135S212_9PEZI|nr:hypothetical protein CSIM01_05553 [Colletotrichum simmondsii]
MPHTNILLMIRQILRLPADGLLLLLLLRRRQVEIKLPAAAMGAKRLLDQLSTGTIRSTPSIRTAKAWDLLWYPTLHQHCMKWTGLLRDHAGSAPGPDPGTTVSLWSLVSGSWSLALCFPIVAQYSSLAHPLMAVKTEGRSAEG